jgi:ABC-2 type transport system ATP-binding protein
VVAEHGTQDSVLKVRSLCKSYVKGKLVNDNISLFLRRGEIFGLLGPNGAGKTTLVSQIIGLAKPDTGSISIDDVDIVARPGYARQACSFQAQTQVPINGLTAKQAIELVGRVRGGDVKTVRVRTQELLKNLEMEEWAAKSAETFPAGCAAWWLSAWRLLRPVALSYWMSRRMTSTRCAAVFSGKR